MTSLKTSIKTITYLSDIGCLEIQGASLSLYPVFHLMYHCLWRKIADNSIVSGVVTERVCHMVFVKDKQNQYEPYIWF
ncbi:hypothetical protein G868_01022 [Escherichia coli HVH 216 (4-3042952)]|nr:hypothetical protein G868_01022 [Escherichia coli HVH 216 (4-3042952)]